MTIEVTQEAVEVLKRSLELGGVDPATGGVRLRAAHGLGGGVAIQVELADGPLEGETAIEAGGINIFIDPGVIDAIPEPVVAVEPQHDLIVVRPATPGRAV